MGLSKAWGFGDDTLRASRVREARAGRMVSSRDWWENQLSRLGRIEDRQDKTRTTRNLEGLLSNALSDRALGCQMAEEPIVGLSGARRKQFVPFRHFALAMSPYSTVQVNTD